MKTYQSITSLATSPAISSSSLYSNGFIVTNIPISNLSASSHSTTTITSTTETTTSATSFHIASTAIANADSTNSTITKWTCNVNDLHDDLQQLQLNGDDTLYQNCENNDRDFNGDDDVCKQIKHMREAELDIVNVSDHDDEELSVENTRL